MNTIKASLIFCAVLCSPGCKSLRTATMGETARGQSALSFGYTPLDPLPVNTKTNSLAEFPDETMRLAVGTVTADGSITYGPARIGGAGSNYVVTLDYIKYRTEALHLAKVTSLETNSFRTNGPAPGYRTTFLAGTNIYYLADAPSLRSKPYYQSANTVVPVYIGVGLRLTANITVRKGEVNLGNLFAIGAGVQSGNVTGTLVVQTLGLSGPTISAAIPIPSEVNPTTIQNALLAIGTIKSKIYDQETTATARVVALYNILGGDTGTMNGLVSSWMESQYEPRF
jgi:hypothetical protein